MRHLAALFLLATLPLFAAEDPAVLIAKLQPAAGWSAPEPARTATSDTLFDLIDGGAELYQEYGVSRVVSWQLNGPERSSIQVELYEMTDAPAAFGVWSLMQTGKYTLGKIGQGSLRTNYYVAFWSGPYFATVTGAQSDVATQAEVDRLAAALAVLLPRPAKLPAWPLLKLYPLNIRKFFRGRIGLSNINVPAPVELFEPGEGVVLTVFCTTSVELRFPSEAEARSHFTKGLEQIRARSALLGFHAESEKWVGKTSDGHPVTIKAHGRDVVIHIGKRGAQLRDGTPIPREERRY